MESASPTQTALELFAGAAVFGGFFFWGIATGSSIMGWPMSVNRVANPIGFWAGQAFNAIIAIITALAGLAVLLGLSPP